MSKIAITGANGFVGSWLTRQLAKDGHEIRVLARPTSDLSDLNGVSFSPVTGDVTDYPSLQRAFSDREVVFHLAGLIAYRKSDREKMEQVNVQGTANVIRACHECKVKQLVYLSSVVAIGAGRSPTEILNEDSLYNISDLDLGYFETKRKAEKLVVEAYRRNEITPIILNPSTIYGPGDAKKSSRRTQIKVAQGKFPFYTSGGVSIVDIEDVIAGIIAAWKFGKPGERYILSGDNITIQDLFRMISRASGAPAPKIYLPNILVHTMGILGDLQTKFGGKSSLSRENAWTATMYHWFDHSKATRELQFKPRPAYESIQKSVNWMKENGFL
jgi:dihydroflavonol-4-reductase